MPPNGDYENPNDHVPLQFGEPYILSTLSGVSGIEADLVTATIAGIDGVKVNYVRTGGRNIDCEVYVHGEDRREMYESRFKLISLLTPQNSPGTLYYQNDYKTVCIKAHCKLPPNFGERIKNYNKSSLSFFAEHPHWQEIYTLESSLSYDIDEGAFSFPFAFEDTISFAENNAEIIIDYMGTVPAPITITLWGNIRHPQIINTTTGETISIKNIVIAEGNTLEINTKRGKKSVVLHTNGKSSSAFNLVTPDSTFFQLLPGRNVIRFTSDFGIGAMNAKVSYRNLYAGV